MRAYSVVVGTLRVPKRHEIGCQLLTLDAAVSLDRHNSDLVTPFFSQVTWSTLHAAGRCHRLMRKGDLSRSPEGDLERVPPATSYLDVCATRTARRADPIF